MYFFSLDVYLEKPHIFTASLETQDHALIGHVIDTYDVKDVLECVRMCKEKVDCYSFNYQYNSSTGHQCHVNNSTRGLSQASFARAAGFVYYDWQVCLGKNTHLFFFIRKLRLKNPKI